VPDLLAAGYGSFSFGDAGGGMVAVWSLKNPTAPLWSSATRAGELMGRRFASASCALLVQGGTGWLNITSGSSPGR
jgi:hypothetical protein